VPFPRSRSGRAFDRADAGGEPGEDRIEMLHHRRLAADHHAEAALEAPHATARPDVDVMDALGRERLRAPEVVDVVRVAAVDHDVARLEQGLEVGDGLVDRRRRHHQPHRARLGELLHEVPERRCAGRPLACERFHRFRRHVEDHAVVAAPDEPPHHVRAHAAESDHSELHLQAPFSFR
jgi:hypothetical protein